MKRTVRFALCLLLPGLLPLHTRAQWTGDTGFNTPVARAEKDQREPSVVSDGNGGAIIAWRDYRYTSSIYGGEILVQRLDQEGTTLWTANGKQVNAAALNKGQFSPVMAEDGDGGAVIAWGRSPLSLYNYDILAQKVSSGGERLWAANDVTVSDATGTESFHRMISDGAGGAILTWAHLPGTPGSTDIYAQRVDSEGAVQWTENGEEICVAAESQSNPELTGDGNNGAIITWSDSRQGMGTLDIYAQKISAEGSVQWTAGGVAVCLSASFQESPVITSDGAGGAIIAWQDARAGNADIYAQRINDTGEPVWNENGIPVCSAASDQQMPRIVSDGAGGAIMVWQDLRSGNADIYAQRVNASGEMLWESNGVAACPAAGNQNQPVAVSDQAGGVILAWVDARDDGQGDIYAQRLNASGQALWNANGTAVCTATGYQEAPDLACDGNQGAIVVWADKRNGEHYDIYAQRIDKNGYPGVFADEDLDGIGDTEEKGENGDDPDYDGNSDGQADHQQAHVASFSTFNGQQYVTLAVPDSVSLENVQATGNPGPDAAGSPEADTYPYGFFRNTISGLTPGSHTVATLLLHNGPGVNTYFKYGATPGESTHWYEFDYDGTTGAVISGDTVFLYLNDGLRGDDDASANGVIPEPGGPILTATRVESHVAEGFSLDQNFPNPFGNETEIAFTTAGYTLVRVEIFDLTGRRVGMLLNEPLPEGRHVVSWDASGIPHGTYILKLSTGTCSVFRKMIKCR
ncbi:MAG TPA: T9SS type A sorting domain-containing protein [Bacteroidetes bacterium]|nr:T9SS type A sorting domain-containing protein [Bacteroidota bacterium]